MKILNQSQYKKEPTEWGGLIWFASKELGNSENMTIGQCRIKPGMSNPRHIHPNCEEVLYVLQGKISHSYNDEEIIMQKGDTISIPAGIPHNAKNIGDVEAILQISFSCAERQSVGE